MEYCERHYQKATYLAGDRWCKKLLLLKAVLENTQQGKNPWGKHEVKKTFKIFLKI